MLRTRSLPPPCLRGLFFSKVCLLLHVLCQIIIGLACENFDHTAKTRLAVATFARAMHLKSLLASECTVPNNNTAVF